MDYPYLLWFDSRLFYRCQTIKECDEMTAEVMKNPAMRHYQPIVFKAQYTIPYSDWRDKHDN